MASNYDCFFPFWINICFFEENYVTDSHAFFLIETDKIEASFEILTALFDLNSFSFKLFTSFFIAAV